MFDIGFAELLLIGVVGLIVVGPEQLPGAVRTTLAWINRFRRSFDQIRTLHGLGPDDVKALMRQNLKSGSYRAWRKRVRTFADRREVYK
ncbi:MAG: twin-arginine translocase subunit TatB [Gammaproteobacteria bacterium]|nr:twin-arginine translocase subunit TatB [Gammaproteobacteria bacterium]